MQTEPAKIYIAAHKIFDTGTTFDRVMLQFLLSKNAQQSPRVCVCRFGRHIHCTSMTSAMQPPFAVKRFPSELCCPFSLGWNWAQFLSHTKYQGGHSVPTQDNYYTFPQTCRMQSRGTANRTAHLARQSIRAPVSFGSQFALYHNSAKVVWGMRRASLKYVNRWHTTCCEKRNGMSTAFSKIHMQGFKCEKATSQQTM